MVNDFECPRCHNKDKRYIGYRNGFPYCRLCLPFQGKEAEGKTRRRKSFVLNLDYPLSEKQALVTNAVLDSIKNKKNVFIHAVTGAGKTELVYHSMLYILNQGGNVGFATPRKDVVIDLEPRIKHAFKSARVVSVYGGHNTTIEGDVICLTTHQLYRYPAYFDLLIVDEIDAFPYKGNDLLISFFKRSVKGNYILLSATPTKEDLEEVKKDNGVIVELFERYHKHPLPVPSAKKVTPITSYITCLKYLRRFVLSNKPTFVFAPTIQEGVNLYNFLSLFVPNGAFVSSEEEMRKVRIERFKNRKLSYLVTTSILERGVTVKNLQVIVFDAGHPLYYSSTLVQIAGRAGRKIDATEGEVIFLYQNDSEEIDKAINEIETYNRKAGFINGRKGSIL